MWFTQLIESGDKGLKVIQFHYTAWPDHGVPDNVMSIISFIRHVRKLFPTSVDQPQPVLVHCSAGIGRSGTFITLDMMMQQMKDKATLSVCQCVRYLRTQRMKMVQTRVCSFMSLSAENVCMWINLQTQYEFIHHALSELVVCGETEMTASRLRAFIDSHNQESGETEAQKHMQVNYPLYFTHSSPNCLTRDTGSWV